MIVYYDTCVFGNSLNASHADYAGCCFVLSMNNINWISAFSSELSEAENPSCGEAIRAFILEAALNGLNFIEVKLASAKSAAKGRSSQKKHLELLGFSGMDWNHLCGAIHSGSDKIFSTDDDFFDPSNKANRRAKPRSRVADYIKSEFGIAVERPGGAA